MAISARIAAVSLLLATVTAWAAPPPGADPNGPMARFYRSLMIPGYNVSCCDESDCRPTQARAVGGAWEAATPDGGWVPIPANRIITDKTHPSGSAVLCYLSGRVLCFVPPAAGG